MAPVSHLPPRKSGFEWITRAEPSVHLQALPEIDPNLRDEQLAARWEKILALKNEVLRVLETARRDKTIGHPLDARVRLALPPGFESEFAGCEELFRSVFIVSGVSIEPESALDAPARESSCPA